jgi:hypothetical protein
MLSQFKKNIGGANQLFLSFFVIISFFASFLYIYSSAASNTNASIKIYDSIGIVIPVFTISPSSYYPNDTNFTAQAAPLKYTNGSIASGINCEFIFTTPNGSQVSLTSTTDVAGVCDFSMSASLVSQNLTLTAGQTSQITSAIGNGSGQIKYFFQSVQYSTNTSNYTVINSVTLSVPNPVVTPPQVYPNDPIFITLPPVEFSNNTVAIGLTCNLEITTPENGIVVISGVTSSTGTITYNANLTLSSQGLTLVSGDLDGLTRSLGQGSVKASCLYNSTPVTSPIPTTYQVIPRPVTLIVPPFDIDKDVILPTENLIFSSGQTQLSNNQPAANLPCTLTITTPSGSQVVLTSTTDLLGECSFDSSLPPATQGWTLVSGQLSDIKIIGNGSALMTILYQGVYYPTNFDTYRVNQVDPVLLPITFEINPETIELGQPVKFTLNPVKFDNNTTGVGLACTLKLYAPNNNQIILSGQTDNTGKCEFLAPDIRTISRFLGIQAEAAVNVNSGNVRDLNAFLGQGRGFAEVVYNNTTIVSNIDRYNVVAQTNEEDQTPVPNLNELPRFIVNTVRSGGILGYSAIFLTIIAILLAANTVRTSLKKD